MCVSGSCMCSFMNASNFCLLETTISTRALLVFILVYVFIVSLNYSVFLPACFHAVIPPLSTRPLPRMFLACALLLSVLHTRTGFSGISCLRPER